MSFLRQSRIKYGTWFLADEPTGNLDSQQRDNISQLQFDLNAEGQTIIMVTYNLEIAAKTKRIITMRDGQIVG